MIGSHDALRRLLAGDEGQYFDRKSLFEGPRARRQPRDRKTVRDQIAAYVAAFANADGGTLVLGVEDDGTITGQAYPPKAIDEMLQAPEKRLRPAIRGTGSVVELDGHKLLVFHVPPSPRAVMVVGDGFPQRVGDQVVQASEEVINRIKDGGVISPERRIAERATLADLNLDLLRRAMTSAGVEGSPEDYLVDRHLADLRGDQLVLRNGAVWLFAKGPRSIDHPNLGIRVFRVHGTEMLVGAQRNVQDYPWIEGSLVDCLERARSLLSTLIRSSTRLHDLFFKEVPEYPTFAWQEALVNAVAHRDYAKEGACVEVHLFEDRLELTSPGALPAEVSLDDILARRRVHVARNPRIARVLMELSFMRQQGEGIPRMIQEMEDSWLPVPEFSASEHQFRVVLRNEPLFEGRDPAWTAHVRELPVNVRQKRALVAFSDGREFQSTDYQQLNQVDRDVAYRELQRLHRVGLIERQGRGKGTHYKVPVNPPSVTTDATALRAGLSQLLDEAGFVTNAGYRKVFGVGREEAKAALTSLVERGVLVRVGEKKGARYERGPNWKGRS